MDPAKNVPERKIAFPVRMGRPPRGPSVRSGRPAAFATRCALKSGESRIWVCVKMSAMIVPKSVAYAVLEEPDETVKRESEHVANGYGTSASTPPACGIRTTSRRTTAAGLHHAGTTRPALLYGKVCSTRPPANPPLRCWARPVRPTAEFTRIEDTPAVWRRMPSATIPISPNYDL